MTPDAGASLRAKSAQCRAMIEAITPPGEPFEIRVLKGRRMTADGLIDDPYTKARSGFYTDPAIAATHAARYSGLECSGVYVTLHQLPCHALSWGANRIAKGEKATADKDVVAYRHLYLDLDPVRPELVNATAEERDRATRRAAQMLAYLRDGGWPDPVWAGISGSGAMMLYRIDLPADAHGQALYRRVLHGLAGLFSDELVTLDTSVYNPARVCRLAGTVNAKAITPQPDRPWSLATGRAMPGAGLIPRAALEAVAAPEVTQPAQHDRPAGEALPTYDLARILTDSGISYRERTRDYGTTYEIADCLTSDDHRDGACFIQLASGAVAYRCLHDRCCGKGWQDVKGRLTLPGLAIVTTHSGPGARPRRNRPSYAIRGGEVVPL